MSWITLAALGLCAAAFFVASDLAPGMRRGRFDARMAFFGAGVFFILTVWLVQAVGVEDGFPTFLGVAIAAIGGVGCFWHTKTHVDHGRSTGAFAAAILGLALFGVAFLLQFSGGAAGPLTGPDGTDLVTQQLERLDQRHRELEERRYEAIPKFLSKLSGDAAEVRRELQRAPEGTKVSLKAELREIARLMLAVEEEERQTEALISRVKQERRRLERLRDSKTVLADDDELLASLDEVWQEAGKQLARPINDRLGGGAIEATRVDQKVQSLLNSR